MQDDIADQQSLTGLVCGCAREYGREASCNIQLGCHSLCFLLRACMLS